MASGIRFGPFSRRLRDPSTRTGDVTGGGTCPYSPLPISAMMALLALLPRGLTTVLFALAALLRFDGSSSSIPIPAFPLSLLGWSLAAFVLATAALLVDLGLEWNRGNRTRNRQARRRESRDRCLAGRAAFQLDPGPTSRDDLSGALDLLRQSLEANSPG